MWWQAHDRHWQWSCRSCELVIYEVEVNYFLAPEKVLLTPFRDGDGLMPENCLPRIWAFPPHANLQTHCERGFDEMLQRLCQKKSPPPLHHHHIHPELLIQDWMDPCFHGVHTKFWLDLLNVTPAKVFQSSIVRFLWAFVNHSLTFLSLSDRSSIVVVSCCCSSFSSRLKLFTYFAYQSLAFLIINRDFPTHPPYFLIKQVFVFSTSTEHLSTQTNNYSIQTHSLISEYAKICMACALVCCYMCFGLKCILFQNLLKTAGKVF